MKVIEGSHAISEAVRLSKVSVISGYPITPQTHIIEEISEYCTNGKMDAKFIAVESEHSAMGAVIGAASCGVRTFTATSSHGLALMHELLHWAAGARLPIVMAEVNRAMGPGWNIWSDQTDSLSQRDTGWIQLYCENGQDALDTTIIAYKLAEAVNLPVMVVIDAFFLSHTFEPVDIPTQKKVDSFLPDINPRINIDTNNPFALNQLTTPQYYMEMRRSIQLGMEEAKNKFEEINSAFNKIFNRKYSGIETVEIDDADIIFITSGTVTSTCRQFLKNIRETGEKVGLIKIKMFRPFPMEKLREVLKGKDKVVVIDRNFSFGASGIFAQEIRASICNMKSKPLVYGFIAGLGGRDITLETFDKIYLSVKNNSVKNIENEWIDLNQEIIESCYN